MIDGLYEDYSKRGSKCYSTFAGGGFLGAGDLNLLSKEYRGLPALLVRNAPDAEMSHERLQAVSYTLAIPASPHTGDAPCNPPPARPFRAGNTQRSNTVTTTAFGDDASPSQLLPVPTPSHSPPSGHQAIQHLRHPVHGNPLVREVMTCYERELARRPGDSFPREAGGGSVPIMTYDTNSLPNRENSASASVDRDEFGHLRDNTSHAPPARTLPAGRTPEITALINPHELAPSSVLSQNALDRLAVGNVAERTGVVREQHAVGTSAMTSTQNALHDVLYWQGEGGYYEKADGTVRCA